MASTSGGSHGGKRENSGRKRKYGGSESRQSTKIQGEKESMLVQKADKNHGIVSMNKRIYLHPNIFHAWKGAKIEAGYSACSDSDFTAHLLSLEYKR